MLWVGKLIIVLALHLMHASVTKQLDNFDR